MELLQKIIKFYSKFVKCCNSKVYPHKHRDEFTHYTEESLKLIQAAVEQLKNLPTQNPEYSKVSINIGSALSAKGDLKKAESLFIQAIEKSRNDDEKSLANFNLFQVRWRKAFAKTTVSEKEELYAQALSALKVAIELSNGRYALHDINKGYYPIKKFLGAGGMGCAFLCENHNELITEYKLVVVKCFWENITGTLKEVFKEPLAMKHIAGVPKPLDYGYADNVNKKQPYFVTEYIEGAIDGEAWLEKEDKLDLKTGLEVGLQIAKCLKNAHENGYIHLDIKPANILLKRTKQGISVKIIDFGLARVTSSLREVADKRSSSGLTVFGQAVFGTLEYAPPEQRGYERQFGKPSEKSDIFAFGKTMYRLLTGELALEIETESLQHAPKWYQLLSDCVRQNPDKRPKSALVLISRLEGIDENRQVEKKRLIKEPEKKEKVERRQAKEPNKKTQYKPREKQPFDWQEFKPTLIVLALIGLGITITIFSTMIFDSLDISFLGEYDDEDSGVIVGLVFSVLLVGQYLWRHRQTMPHLAMVFGLIGVGFAIFVISVIIFLDIKFIGGSKRGTSGIMVGNFLSILLVGQYLWRHRQTMPHLAMVFGLIWVGFAIPFISAAIFDFLDIRFLGYRDDESGVIVGLLPSLLLLGQYLWRHRQTMPHLAMVFGLIGVGFAILFISSAIFDFLDIRFLGYRADESGAIVGLLPSLLLLGQYLWRHWQSIPRSTMITGAIGIAIFSFLIFSIAI